MPADRLDDATEQRIREACPYHSNGDPLFQAQCWWCGLLRAAIKADREARGPSADEVLALRCSKHYTTLPIVNMPDGKECAICLRDDERAHADALAECLRDCEDRAELGYAVRNRRLTLLAAHDKRRRTP